MVEKDPVTWNAKIEALRNVGLEVLEIVNRVGSKPILSPIRSKRRTARTSARRRTSTTFSKPRRPR